MQATRELERNDAVYHIGIGIKCIWAVIPSVVAIYVTATVTQLCSLACNVDANSMPS